ncbi:MAG TPA: hypothetical protein VND68_14360 [Chloroflexia bacterium]|nr:hypothetical protein [Chloroflexia bacterium]
MKHRMAWAATLALLSCCLQLGAAGRAFACSCAMPPTALDALDQADAVFTGTVLRVTPINQNAPGGIYSSTPSSNEVVFSVLSVWKGVSRRQVTVLTGMGGGDCGYIFTAGDTYLVYARSSYPGGPVFSLGNLRVELPVGAQQFGTGICTRTAPFAQAAADLAQLGPGTQPLTRGLLDIVLDNLLAVVAVVAALFIVLVLYLLRRRRRRSFRLKP